MEKDKAIELINELIFTSTAATNMNYTNPTPAGYESIHRRHTLAIRAAFRELTGCDATDDDIKQCDV